MVYNPMNREIYEDFYVAYLDSAGRVIYPTDIDEVKVIKKMMKNASKDGLYYTEDGRQCYKIRIKRKVYDGQKVQVVELSNVTEYMKRISDSSVDKVTHLNNRRLSSDLFIKYIEKAYSNGEGFTIMLGDIDGFKQVNDTYGHPAGDVVLSEISRILFCSVRQEYYREQDIISRMGGDEFEIVFKNIPRTLAEKRAEKIRKEVEEKEVPIFIEDTSTKHIGLGTLSIGLYHVTPEDLDTLYSKGYTTEEIMRTLEARCDKALYTSKSNGKNQVTTYTKEKEMVLD